MNPGFIETTPPAIHQFRHRVRGFGGGHGAEADPLAAIGIPFDDVAVPLFVVAGIPDLTPRQAVQAADRCFGKGQLRALFVNQRQGVPITPDFFLIPVAQQRDA